MGRSGPRRRRSNHLVNRIGNRPRRAFVDLHVDGVSHSRARVTKALGDSRSGPSWRSNQGSRQYDGAFLVWIVRLAQRRVAQEVLGDWSDDDIREIDRASRLARLRPAPGELAPDLNELLVDAKGWLPDRGHRVSVPPVRSSGWTNKRRRGQALAIDRVVHRRRPPTHRA